MAYGKSIELFLVNGTADSLIIAELSNWNGKKAVVVTKDAEQEMLRKQINEMWHFLQTQTSRITEYDEQLVRRLIEKSQFMMIN